MPCSKYLGTRNSNLHSAFKKIGNMGKNQAQTGKNNFERSANLEFQLGSMGLFGSMGLSDFPTSRPLTSLFDLLFFQVRSFLESTIRYKMMRSEENWDDSFL